MNNGLINIGSSAHDEPELIPGMAKVTDHIKKLEQENKNLKQNEKVREEKLQEITLENNHLKEENKNLKDPPYECYCTECGECLNKPAPCMTDEEFQDWFMKTDGPVCDLMCSDIESHD
jgi:hypothetical protein